MAVVDMFRRTYISKTLTGIMILRQCRRAHKSHTMTVCPCCFYFLLADSGFRFKFLQSRGSEAARNLVLSRVKSLDRSFTLNLWHSFREEIHLIGNMQSPTVREVLIVIYASTGWLTCYIMRDECDLFKCLSWRDKVVGLAIFLHPGK